MQQRRVQQQGVLQAAVMSHGEAAAGLPAGDWVGLRVACGWARLLGLRQQARRVPPNDWCQGSSGVTGRQRTAACVCGVCLA